VKLSMSAVGAAARKDVAVDDAALKAQFVVPDRVMKWAKSALKYVTSKKPTDSRFRFAVPEEQRTVALGRLAGDWMMEFDRVWGGIPRLGKKRKRA
jgi:hypothetical protein